MKTTFAIGVVLLASVVAMQSSPAKPGRDETYEQRENVNRRLTLEGLQGLGVYVEQLPPCVEADGLTTKSLRTIVEIKLRSNGIRVLEGDEAYKNFGAPVLHVFVSALKNKSIYAYCVDVKLLELVTLIRKPNMQPRLAYTMEVESSFGLTGENNVRDLRDIVSDKVDEFVNEWLAANPPAPSSQPARP